MEVSRIIVSRIELAQAINVLQLAAKGKNPPDLVIYSEPNGLGLHVGGSTAIIKGDGIFFTQARIPGIWVRKLKQLLPDTSEVEIGQVDGYVSIGNIRITCKWEIPEPIGITIPINASWVQVLGLKQRYSVAEIEKSGLRKKFEAAYQERENRISTAFEALSPMGVKECDLIRLVDEGITRLNNCF